MLIFISYLLLKILTDYQLKLNDLITRDPLTGVYNRRHMLTLVQQAVEGNKRGFGPISLVALDNDHFKQINDQFGHDAGDLVLKNLSGLMLKQLRVMDSVFRAGGEELVILLNNINLDQAAIFAERLRSLVENEPLLENTQVTISLGVAEYQKGESSEEWFKRADDQLYAAKRSGRNRVC